MRIKNILITALFIGTSVSAAENRLTPKRLKPTPPATPPTQNSPQITKKEHTNIFAVSADQIGIQTKTDKEQDLQTYLHHNLHHMHEEVTKLQKQLDDFKGQAADLHAKVDVQSSTLNNALETHEKHITKQIHDKIQSSTTAQAATPMLVDIGEGEKRTVDEAFKYLEDRCESTYQEIKSVKDAHNKRLSELEEVESSEGSTKTAHKSWLRWIADHFVASAVVATGLYHANSLTGTLTQLFPTLLRSTVLKTALPYIYFPAGLLFFGTLTADIHHNLQDPSFAKHRTDWKSYFNAHSLIPIRQPSDLLVSTAVITKACTDNFYQVMKPACKMVINTGIVQLMIAAGALTVLSKAPNVPA